LGMGNFRFILDRPHCKEHLSNAGQALGHPPVLPWSAPRSSGAGMDRCRPVSSARPPLVLALPNAGGRPSSTSAAALSTACG
jgi:hypothetical protein